MRNAPLSSVQQTLGLRRACSEVHAAEPGRFTARGPIDLTSGSVLALAALAAMVGEATLDRVALLTHGSPIGRMYYRIFPAHVGDPIRSVAEALTTDGIGRWHNLYRPADPGAGRRAQPGAEPDERFSPPERRPQIRRGSAPAGPRALRLLRRTRLRDGLRPATGCPSAASRTH